MVPCSFHFVQVYFIQLVFVKSLLFYVQIFKVEKHVFFFSLWQLVIWLVDLVYIVLKYNPHSQTFLSVLVFYFFLYCFTVVYHFEKKNILFDFRNARGRTKSLSWIELDFVFLKRIFVRDTMLSFFKSFWNNCVLLTLIGDVNKKLSILSWFWNRSVAVVWNVHHSQ